MTPSIELLGKSCQLQFLNLVENLWNFGSLPNKGFNIHFCQARADELHGAISKEKLKGISDKELQGSSPLLTDIFWHSLSFIACLILLHASVLKKETRNERTKKSMSRLILAFPMSSALWRLSSIQIYSKSTTGKTRHKSTKKKVLLNFKANTCMTI